jgi:hypothetical protein
VSLTAVIVGGLTVGQFLPAGWRQYMPGIATQAAVTVHRSAGLLRPRPRPRRARRVRRNRPSGGVPAGVAPRRLSFVPVTRGT